MGKNDHKEPCVDCRGGKNIAVQSHRVVVGLARRAKARQGSCVHVWQGESTPWLNSVQCISRKVRACANVVGIWEASTELFIAGTSGGEVVVTQGSKDVEHSTQKALFARVCRSRSQ